MALAFGLHPIVLLLTPKPVLSIKRATSIMEFDLKQTINVLSLLLSTLEASLIGTVSSKQLPAAWIINDLGHIDQISRAITKQYKLEFGFWINHLSILTK